MPRQQTTKDTTDDSQLQSVAGEFPALRQDINRQHVVFSLFDGDLKSGSERCDDSLS